MDVFSDSKLVVNQVSGSFEAKDSIMTKYHELVETLRAQFKKCTVTHIPRTENTRANALSMLTSVLELSGSEVIHAETLEAWA